MSDNFIEYDGIKFYKDKKGYFLSERTSNNKSLKRLHIYVWEKFNGPVPKGYHIHHIDHDKNNNEIDNLELIERHKHIQYHALLQDKEKAKLNLEEKARPKAIEWHKSEAGREWHKQHYENMKNKFHTTVFIKCAACGKEVEVKKGGAGNKFCSNKCKSQYRRNSKSDNIISNCIICGKEFSTNKYSSAKCCSDECRRIKRNENKKN